MMKVLALFVVIAIVVWKGEADTDGKWKLKKGSPRVMKVIESTMKDPALEQEILEALILGMAASKDKQTVAEMVKKRIEKMASSVILIIPSPVDPDEFAYASSTTEFVRIQETTKADVDYYVFKIPPSEVSK